MEYSSRKYTIHKMGIVESRLQGTGMADSYPARVSRRLLRFAGRRLSTRRTNSDPVMPRTRASSRIAIKEGLFFPRSSKLIYFGWYPLSKASASCVIPRSSRSVISTRAKARFSRAPRSSMLPERAIGSPDRGQIPHIMPQSILSGSVQGCYGFSSIARFTSEA